MPRLKATVEQPSDAEALRHEVAESWVGSLSSVDPGQDGAPVADGGAVHHWWAGSPMRRPVVDDLAVELRGIANDAGFVTAVTDESGTILWTCGGRTTRRRAERRSRVFTDEEWQRVEAEPPLPTGADVNG
jgi:hypothetical protein